MSQTYDPRIAQARRAARAIARDRGTPYQAALDEVARTAGAADWSMFAREPTDLPAPVVVKSNQASRTDSCQQAIRPDRRPFSPEEVDLVRRVAVGLLGVVLMLVLGVALLMTSTVTPYGWSGLVEGLGTTLCAAAVLAVPTAMSGYLLGIRLRDVGHAMPARWRLVMLAFQGCFVGGVVHHMLAA